MGDYPELELSLTSYDGLDSLFRQFVENQADTVCVFEPAGAIRFANKSFASFFGVSAEDLIGSHISDLSPETQRDEAQANLEKLALMQPGEVSRQEFELADQAGRPGWFEFVDQPVFDQHDVLALIVSVGRNITEQHRTKAELEDLNRRLNESNRELTNFAYVASHDLREPLRKISAFSSRLTSHAGASLDARSLDYLDRMNSAADRMQRLIDGLLTLSRVSTNAQEFETTDLTDVMTHVVSDLGVAIAESDAVIRVGPMPSIAGDRAQLGELFQNLVANAIKFRADGVVPIVSINSERTATSIVLTVTDNGIGFEAKHAESIFETFARLHGRSDYDGSGIGLSVCKRIVERHGGVISATSQPGQGSSFRIELPA